ncbi:MAG: family 16 glycosylhydrolase [Clostridiaceae bacterium]|nr:family 16 glycosylhydrolase [Clostridiaceae bacterium]
MLKKHLSKLWLSLLLFTFVFAYTNHEVSAAQVVNSNFEAYFTGSSSQFESANWPNGNPFNCVWRPSQVTFSNGSMFLNLTRDDTGSGYPYKSGEYRTNAFFGFGYYEVRMKATKNPGVVSSFFTYTGPSDNNPWDEIDIEFLGRDTTMVQFNWYKDGVGGNEYYHRLGFDASEDFHTYGFEWRSNYISYYVDGVKVYTGTRNIPQTPGKIMMNLWPGIGVDEWLGSFNGRTPLTAEYKYIKYYPNGVPAPTNPNTPTPTPNRIPTPTSTQILNSNFEAYFTGSSNQFESANWPNGNPFNCVWRPSQVTFSNGSMFLNLTRDNTGSGYPYKSGEYRTNAFFGFGYYEVRMKATKNPGVVSSFFTYTGPSDNNPWDEIDIEFLGRDTTMVQFNWYKDGVGGNEYYHRLGFDASEDFHTYGFEWRPNYISYYVDGVKVYTGTRNIPQTPGKIMMNLWPGIGVDEWLGSYDGKTPLTAEYKYIKYYPDGVPSNNTPAPSNTIVGDLNDDGEVNSLDFGSLRLYLLGTINDFPAKDDLKAGDLNGDGEINSLDFGFMRRYLLGDISKFPAS